MERQYDKIKRYIEGEEIEWFSEVKLLIFGNFKKHTFKYQFLSTAIPVDGVNLKSI